jgi:outer membrane lipase/esterase
MAFNRLRRALVLAMCASSALLASCGGGGDDVVSQLTPTRIIGFGDGFSDVGQAGSRYSINDGTVNVWSEYLASAYARPLLPVSAGGLSYAVGNARVLAKPDAAGKASTPTVKEQVDTFLASQTIGSNDMVIVGAGIADIVAEFMLVRSGAQSSDQMLANVGQAGRDLGAQVRRLVQAGAKHVVVAGTYNLSRSPLAAQTGQGALLDHGSQRFNDQMLISIVDLGANVLYVDAALYLNLVTSSPSSYSLDNVGSIACISADAGPGIGIGNGQVNSSLCTNNTLLPGIDPGRYLFADALYLTPQGARLFGDYAFQQVRKRW